MFFLLENRPQSSGAILMKCNGTVINLDPVLFTWLAYYPRMSPVVDTSSRGKQLRKAVSHTRSVSTVTPRKKSYARGMKTDIHYVQQFSCVEQLVSKCWRTTPNFLLRTISIHFEVTITFLAI